MYRTHLSLDQYTMKLLFNLIEDTDILARWQLCLLEYIHDIVSRCSVEPQGTDRLSGHTSEEKHESDSEKEASIVLVATLDKWWISKVIDTTAGNTQSETKQEYLLTSAVLYCTNNWCILWQKWTFRCTT